MSEAVPNTAKMLEQEKIMVRPMSGPDSSAPARPQLDPHAVWAQNMPGKTPSADAPVAGRDGQVASYSEADMAEPQFAMHNDDDLPRTFRRERDARRQAQSYRQDAQSGLAPSIPDDEKRSFGSDEIDQAPAATVTGFDVPFLRLVTFFLKCAVAAIPALIVLGLIMFAMGQVAERVFPWLVKMRIVVSFPG